MPKGMYRILEGKTGICARPACGKPYPMNHPNKLYCSDQCQVLEKKRRKMARLVGQALVTLGSKVSQSQDLFASP
jgi:predicted nucleic acid-binding Zn ribbon protein